MQIDREQQYNQSAAEFRLVLTRAEAELGTQRSIRFYGPDGRERTLPVRIPAGTAHGARLILEMPAARAGEIGLSYRMILIVVMVLPHVHTEFCGSDITVTLQADRAEAERNGEVRVQLEDGRVLAAPIRRGVSHERFVYFGQGLPRGTAGMRCGDLILHVELLDIEPDADTGVSRNSDEPQPWWRSLFGPA